MIEILLIVGIVIVGLLGVIYLLKSKLKRVTLECDNLSAKIRATYKAGTATKEITDAYNEDLPENINKINSREYFD